MAPDTLKNLDLRTHGVACPQCGTVDSESSVRPWWKRKANGSNIWRASTARLTF